MPNDNNVGQRNVVLAPGGAGAGALMQSLNGYSFWVGNQFWKKAVMELKVQLPSLLDSNNWKLSFKNISENRFELEAGKQQEIFIELLPGKEFNKQQVENTDDRDIQISVYGDNILIGGMTYRLDPNLKEPFNKTQSRDGESACLDKAQELLDCMEISNKRVNNVCIKRVTVDIELDDDKCCS